MITIWLVAALMRAVDIEPSGPIAVTVETLAPALEQRLAEAAAAPPPCREVLSREWRETLVREAGEMQGETFQQDLERFIEASRADFLAQMEPLTGNLSAIYDPLSMTYLLNDDSGLTDPDRIDAELKLAYSQDQFWRGFAEAEPRHDRGDLPPDIVETFSLSRICAVDAANAGWLAARLEQLITPEAFETGAIRATTALLLHADAAPELQVEAIRAITTSSLPDEFGPERKRLAARLADRILVNSAQTQLFGTAWRCDGRSARPFGTLPSDLQLAANREHFDLPDIEHHRREVEARCQ